MFELLVILFTIKILLRYSENQVLPLFDKKREVKAIKDTYF